VDWSASVVIGAGAAEDVRSNADWNETRSAAAALRRNANFILTFLLAGTGFSCD
jgi:hypothetical protein